MRGRAGRHRQPLGRRGRPERPHPGQGRVVQALLHRQRHARRTRRARDRRPVGRAVRHLLRGDPAAQRVGELLLLHVHLARRHRSGPGRLPTRRQRRPVPLLYGRRVAAGRGPARGLRARHRAPGAGQPGRLSARRPEERHAGHRRECETALAAQELRRRGGRPRDDRAARHRRLLRTERPLDRLRRLQEAGHRPHPGRRRRDQPPLRHRYGRLREAAPGRREVLLPPAQRHRDPRRPASGLRPRGRTRRRGAQPGRLERALSARRLRLHARRHRRLVRRRRPRQVRRQRRHLHLGAAEHLRTVPHRPHRAAGQAGRRLPRHPGERQQGAGHPRRGPLGARLPAEDAGAGRTATGRHGPPQGARRAVDRPAVAAR